MVVSVMVALDRAIIINFLIATAFLDRRDSLSVMQK